MTWTWQRRNLKRETESILVAAKNKAIKNYEYPKGKIDNTQNNKSWLCDDRDETVNHRKSKCSKLAQKERKIRHDWVRNVIHRELCKLKSVHTNGIYTNLNLY